MLDFLASVTPLAISAAVIMVCLTMLVAIAAVSFAGLDIETGGKFFSMKLRKRQKLSQLPPVSQVLEAAPEASLPSVESPIVLVHEPVAQEAEVKAGDDQEQAKGEGGGDSDGFWKWVSAKTVTELDAAADGMFKAIDSEAVEFWRTEHLCRREQMGAQSREAMRDLASANPTWARPHAVMLDWAIADHDYATARRHMDAGLARAGSPYLGEVISSGVRLVYKIDGRQAALTFALRWSKAGTTDAIRATGLFALAQILKDAGDADGSFVASEYASIVHAASDEFSLAYSYSRSSSRWAPALWHYMRHISATSDSAVARNNVGVLYSQLDKALAIRAYERADAEGDKFAPANLAHLLIADGYTALALTLLDRVEDPGNAAENHASARTAALAAQRRTDDRATEVKAAIEAAVGPYRASLASALRFLQDAPESTITGIFATAERDVVAFVDGAKVRCQIRAGAKVYEGTLQSQVTCFTGWLSTSGSTILSQEVAEFTLLNEGNGRLRLFRWPTSSGLNSNFATFELQQVQEPSQLAPPPAQQPQGLLASFHAT